MTSLIFTLWSIDSHEAFLHFEAEKQKSCFETEMNTIKVWAWISVFYCFVPYLMQSQCFWVMVIRCLKSNIIKHSNHKICGKKPSNVNSSKFYLGVKVTRLVVLVCEGNCYPLMCGTGRGPDQRSTNCLGTGGGMFVSLWNIWKHLWCLQI